MICIYFSKPLILLQPESGNANGLLLTEQGLSRCLQPIILSAMMLFRKGKNGSSLGSVGIIPP